jgi:hypothetical protein
MSVLANQIAYLFHTLSERIRYADSSDFGVLAVTVIVAVWYVNRYLGD